MKDKNILSDFVDVEKAGFAAARGLDFSKSGLEDTQKNRELFRILQAETVKIMRGGADVNVIS